MRPHLQIKIDGLRELEHARAAVDAGADYIGFIFAPARRRIEVEAARRILDALPRRPKSVGVFVNEQPERVAAIASACGLEYVQLCGDESPDEVRSNSARLGGARVVKSLRVRPEDTTESVRQRLDAYAALTAWCVLDGFTAGAYGGSGARFDWSIAGTLARSYRIMVAGGLTPENVGEAIITARPWGVDVSSGVEIDGRKDSARIAAFVAAARAAEFGES